MTDAAADARAALESAVARLSAANARTESLAELRTPRGIGPFRRAPRFVPIAEVWRLGVLLLAAEPDGTGRVFATGAVTRAREPRHPNFTSVSAEERRELREAARRAGFAAGQTVDYDAQPLPLDDTLGRVGPLVLRDGMLFVSWNATRAPDSLTPFASYLAERVDLLVEPPPGA
ncbi:MAG TPA: hypothetical protein VFQ74_02660 [Pseudolysinimonas sp.]|nr:hypothetical protein [Pseudolysinimonas sp.]